MRNTINRLMEMDEPQLRTIHLLTATLLNDLTKAHNLVKSQIKVIPPNPREGTETCACYVCLACAMVIPPKSPRGDGNISANFRLMVTLLGKARIGKAKTITVIAKTMTIIECPLTVWSWFKASPNLKSFLLALLKEPPVKGALNMQGLNMIR